MTVYADVLFLINFSMDFLTLTIAGRIMSRRLVKSRLVISALIGGLAGTIMNFLPGGGGWRILLTLCGITVSLLMTLIAFEWGGLGRLVRDSGIIWGAGTLLGGLATIIMTMGEPVYLDYGNDFPTVFLFCSAGAALLSRIFTSARAKKSSTVHIHACGECYTIDVLCDSGSFASDPISGVPAIILRASVMPGIHKKLKESDAGGMKLRMIPVRGLGGESLLYGVIPDRITVNGREVEAVIAFSENDVKFGGYDGILPASLCQI